MKFKGAWKGYIELCKHSIEWLKDYWLIYIIVCILFALIYSAPTLIEDYKWRKSLTKKSDDDLDDFLNF